MKYENALSRYRERYDEYKEDYEFCKNRLTNLEPEKIGNFRNIFSNNCVRVGVLAYVLEGDVAAFQNYLSKAAEQKLLQFEEFDKGGPVDESYVSMLPAQRNIFRALAASDSDLATKLSNIAGGREEIESKYDNPFQLALGYLIKSFVQGDGENLKRDRIEGLRSSGEKNISGLILAFEAILANDEMLFDEALEAIVADHMSANTKGGIFDGEMGEVICIYGIGLANHARQRGMKITFDSPYIPKKLTQY